MSEHYIKNIEIKNFKCFEDFKAEGFGRVNLIGGKNNVGKTAFMEACFLSLADGVYDLYKKLLEIKTHRNVVNNLLLKNDRQQDLKQLILENTNIDIYRKDHYINKDEYEDYECGKTFIQKDKKTGNYIILTHYDNIEHEFDYAYSRIIELIDENINFSKAQFSLNFISQYSHTNNILNWIISEAKLQNKYDDLNKYLLEIFNVQNIDTIRNKPLIKTNDKYIELSEFGQGIKTFINIISSILLLKDDVIFIDEIENGIHYTNLDKLWEIILTISKQQNVQVFATTHSKECIESYARVAKKLKDDEITFLDMGRKKDGTVGMITMNSERFYREIEMDNEVRGW